MEITSGSFSVRRERESIPVRRPTNLKNNTSRRGEFTKKTRKSKPEEEKKTQNRYRLTALSSKE